jgi:serine phosphatase RsbU (regulator of sigma subunit)
MKSSVSLYLYNKDSQLTLSQKIKFVSLNSKDRLINIYRSKELGTLNIPPIARQSESTIYPLKEYPELLFFNFKHPLENKKVIIAFDKSLLKNLFDISENQISLLLTNDVDKNTFEHFLQLAPGQIIETDLNGSKFLAITNKTETTNQIFVTALRKSDLFAFADSIRKQNSALALIIICISSIFGILFSRSITSSIYELIFAAGEVAKGNYKISFKKVARDEIGDLQVTMMKMANEIEASLIRERDLIRIENDFKIASLVQKTFFSRDSFKNKDLEISGFYEPATECSGDWWGFFEVGHYHYFLIGDATGHGASSALITAKAYSLVNTLMYQMQSGTLPILDPAAIMDSLNHVIASSNQVLMMTFLIIRVDIKTMELLHCNASHDFPIIISPDGTTNSLAENPQYRLGHKKEAVYVNYGANLSRGDIIFLFTDGLTECSNGKQLYELKRPESILKKNFELSTREMIDKIVENLKSFNHLEHFEDDVGILLIKTYKDLEKSV